MEVERQSVGDVDHGVGAGGPTQLAFPDASHRPPIRLRQIAHVGCRAASCPERPQARRRGTTGARQDDHVPGLGAGPRHRWAPTGFDRPQHGHRDGQLSRLRHVASDDLAPAGGRGLGHAGHDPERQLTVTGATWHAEGHQGPDGNGTHRGQVAQCSHEGLPAHVSWAADRQVDMDPLDHAVHRHHQRAAVRKAHHGGIVAQSELLDSVSQHRPDTL